MGNVSIETPVTSPTSKKEALTRPTLERKASTRKENKKPSVQIQENILPIDTVPPSKKISEKEKAEYNDLKFPSVSSSINDDGKTRTEDITVTDGNGKKYRYTKLNGKLTSLIIDGRTIPENEYDNYSALLDKIEMVVKENRTRRLFQLENRKLALAHKSLDLSARTEDRNLQRKLLTLQKQSLLEENRQSRKLNRSNQTLDNKKKEMMKLLEQLRERKQGVPMLNGREIIKNDIHLDNSTAVDVAVSSALSKPQDLVLQKIAGVQIAPDIRVEKNLQVKPASISLKYEAHFDITNEKQNDVIVKPSIEWNSEPARKNKKSGLPVETAPAIKVPGKTQPVQLKSTPVQPVKRRVTT